MQPEPAIPREFVEKVGTRAKKKKDSSRSNSRPITRLEALTSQANAAKDQNQIRTSSW